MFFINQILPLDPIPPIKPLAMSASNGNVLVSKYIDCIRESEQKYPNSSSYEILGSLRLLYYYGEAFYQLIPDFCAIASAYPFPVLLSRECLSTLKSRANENGIEDNPSPYLVLRDNGLEEKIDVGHLLLVLDALLHPRAETPYLEYKIPNQDLAGWVADLAIAAYWNEIYKQGGKAALASAQFIVDDLRKKINLISVLTLDDFYQWSAPETDLLGNIDGFGIKIAFDLYPTNSLSYLFFRYFTHSTNPLVKNRYYYFCLKNCLNYNLETKDWEDLPSIRSRWIPRINRCIDLFVDGKFGSVWNAFGIPPSPKSYNSSFEVFDKFLNWLKIKVQAELLQNPTLQRSSGTLFPKSLCP